MACLIYKRIENTKITKRNEKKTKPIGAQKRVRVLDRGVSAAGGREFTVGKICETVGFRPGWKSEGVMDGASGEILEKKEKGKEKERSVFI